MTDRGIRLVRVTFSNGEITSRPVTATVMRSKHGGKFRTTMKSTSVYCDIQFSTKQEIQNHSEETNDPNVQIAIKRFRLQFQGGIHKCEAALHNTIDVKSKPIVKSALTEI
ncbi:hypothetical protein KC19_3G109800 [Ceratodon purpureus]|uniref:Uncharacterized protein n=1 Tax=Ceratodon purpureus TaxID=3225 RepID=A0A8T0IJQ8_CERPU|nr:hypothetical protein KC19_3G109800 [Ceratodon purpureus]